MQRSENIEFDNVFQKSNVDYEFIDQIQNSFNEDCVFFLTITSFLKEIPNLEQWLSSFFKCNSFLVLNDNLDGSARLYKSLTPEIVTLMKKYKDRILIYHTGQIEKDVVEQLKDLNLVKRQDCEYMDLIKYIHNQKIKDLKLERSNKFLLTTVLYKNRVHRTFLVNELTRLDMLTHHIGKIHPCTDTLTHDSNTEKYINWVGDTSTVNCFEDGNISWDLYDTASFEIAPETLHTYASYITEKTLKPIVAKMPFLILSNREYYTYLRSIGFKTFDSLIDESFACIEDTQLRSEGVAAAAKYIIDNDALKFHEASKEICEYNFNHWLYLKSKADYDQYNNMINFQSHIDNFNN